ncbi:uncharacterized protein LOC113508921 [Trichoplusia ni]|uniref:Metalloendopeptidase n=1 Tax=Trichoplusia ni TaxID=7111 RepID=A0A7E5X5U7_TRINI|nr:uncharacterized protein LOC113508921 [Trichoplusia ni]
MRLHVACVFGFIFLIHYGEGKLWSKGVVHYAINKKDYDPHSQDMIVSALDRIEKEVCVKFFNTPLNYTATDSEKILYISNPEKRKTCPPEQYDYTGSVVDMPIGYKCLNEKDIARIIVDMLRASIEAPLTINSNDLLRKFQERNDNQPNILAASDRNFINAHYHEECSGLVRPQDRRRSNGGTMEVTPDNERFYKDKLWPLGIVMYGVNEFLHSTTEFATLQHAMSAIELSTCVVFQQVSEDGAIKPKNLLWFSDTGEEMPNLGFTAGNQTVTLMSMIHGAPGHSGHTLNLLLRILGVPMMSNRFDRDNYVTVNWRNVQKTKEHYLERMPAEAWLRNTEGEGAAYDYDSVTHAPANYMCNDCSLGAQTVQPIQDHLWQRTLTMGHRNDLSPADVELLNLLYNNQCQQRFINNN